VVTSHEKYCPRRKANMRVGVTLSSNNPLAISVCIFVDVLNDFMLPSGRFCATYGLQDTQRIRNIHPNLIDLYQHCHKRGIQVILITSHYQPQQFKRIKDLCSTEEGCRVSLPLLPRQTSPSTLGSKEQQQDIVHTKTSNSPLSCSEEEKDLLLRTVSHQKILICGVTTLCCVRQAVDALKDFTSEIIITKDTVSSRDSSSQQEQRLFAHWKEEEKREDKKRGRQGQSVCGQIHLFETWKEILT
jgi:nicotinamidase-related amidase